MLVKLPESARDRKRSFGGTAASTLIHALVIGGTIAATGEIAQRASEPPQQVITRYVVPPPKDRPMVTPPPAEQRIATNIDPPTVVAPTAIDLSIVPEMLPPTNSTIGTVGVKDFNTLARDSVPVGTLVPASREPFTESTVERVVQAHAGNPSPRYPSMLASAGVEGIVYAQFVVDTAGRVETETIRFPKSDHQLFERAVREVLLRSRFSPAQVGNHPVRQLVEQAFSFTLKR